MEIKSMAKINYSYDLNGVVLQATTNSNIVKTEVRKFDLLLKKLANQEIYKPNDVITYTLILFNNGNYKNTNIIINDNLLNQQLIDYSINSISLFNNEINPSYKLENDNLIININQIQPNEVIIISYNVIIINNPSLITTKTSITSKETQAKEINSLSLKEGFAEIECIKTVSDEITFLNTDLTYILKLNNKGNINAYNIEVFDELPVTFELDNYNPISINNSPIDYVLDNNILKLTIPLIEANSSLNIKINGQITK